MELMRFITCLQRIITSLISGIRCELRQNSRPRSVFCLCGNEELKLQHVTAELFKSWTKNLFDGDSYAITLTLISISPYRVQQISARPCINPPKAHARLNFVEENEIKTFNYTRFLNRTKKELAIKCERYNRMCRGMSYQQASKWLRDELTRIDLLTMQKTMNFSSSLGICGCINRRGLVWRELII